MPRLTKAEKQHDIFTSNPFVLSDKGMMLVYRNITDDMRRELYKRTNLGRFLLEDISTNLAMRPYREQKGPVYPVYLTDNYLVALYDGAFYGFEYGDFELSFDQVPSAVLLKEYPVNKFNKKHKHVVILNGDAEEEGWDGAMEENSCKYPIAEDSGLEAMPTVSFRCLSELTGAHVEDVVKMLRSMELTILAYIPDQRIDLRKSDKEHLKAGKPEYKLKPPKQGFTLLSHCWHCSATVVLYNNKNDETYLIGQDEGTYFGCVLPERVTSVEDAYECLKPPEARKGNVLRQGEWFFVPVSRKNLPSEVGCDALFEESIIMPIDDENANRHYLFGEGMVHEGTIYCHDPRMEHDDHATVKPEGWYALHKNTALRSVSVDGVD